jgi:hypothetical protein
MITTITTRKTLGITQIALRLGEAGVLQELDQVDLDQNR